MTNCFGDAAAKLERLFFGEKERQRRTDTELRGNVVKCFLSLSSFVAMAEKVLIVS